MKKIILVLTLILLMVGCRKHDTDIPEATTPSQVATTTAVTTTEVVPTTTVAPEVEALSVLTIDYQVVNGAYLFGLIDLEGQVVVDYLYDSLEVIEDTGSFLAFLGDDRYFIDRLTGVMSGPFKANNYLTDQDKLVFNNDIVRYKDETTNLYGYRNQEEVLTPAIYITAEPFIDGYAVVREAPYYDHKSQVIDEAFNEVFNHEEGIVAYGKGYFGLVQDYTLFSNQYNKVYLVNADKKPILGDLLFEVDVLNEDLLLVADNQKGWLIDGEGAPANEQWHQEGLDLIKSYEKAEVVDGMVFLYKDLNDLRQFDIIDREGSLIFNGSQTLTTRVEDLGLGYQVESKEKYADRFIQIEYPHIIYKKDQEKLDKANSLLKAASGGEDNMNLSVEDVYMTYETTYEAERIGHILRVEFSNYWYGFGAAHPNYFSDTLHIDLLSGQAYTLADMMTSEAIYQTLTDKVRAMALEEPDKYFDIDEIVVDKNTGFNISAKGIELYYNPYDIGPYAAGTIEFFVPFSEIEEDLNIYSDFYNHLN